MTDLLARLEQAAADQQAEVIADVLEYAANQEWIDTRTYGLALGWVFSGAFESAALTLVPKGWYTIHVGQNPISKTWYWGLGVSAGTDGRTFAEDVDNEPYRKTTPALALCIAALRARG